jgi:polysaccharide export outer membrane protein
MDKSNLSCGTKRIFRGLNSAVGRREGTQLIAVFFWLVTGLFWVTGCGSSRPDVPTAWSSLPAGVQPYRSTQLQEGDVVQVVFQGATNLNTQQRIQLDGTIQMQFIGPVPALGKTPTELQAELIKLYEPQLKLNEITVTVVSQASAIYVSGAVLRPGKLPYDRSMTVLQAIMEAGGYDPRRAKLSEVVVFRVENGLQMSYKLDLKRLLKGQDSGVFHLQPFDIVHVPEKTFNF